MDGLGVPLEELSRDEKSLVQDLLALKSARSSQVKSITKKRNKQNEIRAARRLADHRKRIRNAKPCLDAATPRTFTMPHLKTRLKKEQERRRVKNQIAKENHLLVKRMAGIMHRKNQFMDNQRPAVQKLFGRHERIRQMELERIEMENLKLLKRLEDASPFCTKQTLEKEWVVTKKKLETMCEYPLILGEAKSPRKRRAENKNIDKKVFVGGKELASLEIFPPRSKFGAAKRNCSPPASPIDEDHSIGVKFGSGVDQCFGGHGFMEESGQQKEIQWYSPTPPRVENVLKGPSPRNHSLRHQGQRIPTLSKVMVIPFAETAGGEYNKVEMKTVTATLILDEASRSLQVNVRRSPDLEKVHTIIITCADVLRFVKGETGSMMYERVAQKLWFRNDQLMLTEKLPVPVLAMLPEEAKQNWTAHSLNGAATRMHYRLLNSGNMHRGYVATPTLDLTKGYAKKENEKTEAQTKSVQPKVVDVDNKEKGQELIVHNDDDKKKITRFQARCRGYLARKEHKKQDSAARVLQGKLRKQISIRNQQRERAKQEREQKETDNAALVLQRNFRRHFQAMRGGVTNTKERRRTIAMNGRKGNAAMPNLPGMDYSATVVQKQFRGHRMRVILAERLVVYGSKYYRIVLRNHTSPHKAITIHEHGETKELQKIVFSFRNEPWFHDPEVLMDRLCSKLLVKREGTTPTIGPFYLVYKGKKINSVKLRPKFRCAARERTSRSAVFLRVYAVSKTLLVLEVYKVATEQSLWFEVAGEAQLEKIFGWYKITNGHITDTMTKYAKSMEIE